MDIKETLKELVPDTAAGDSTTITFLWLTFLTTFIWASMLKYSHALIFVLASTLAYILFEIVIVRRRRLHYFMWYLSVSLLAVTVSKLLLNKDLLASTDPLEYDGNLVE